MNRPSIGAGNDEAAVWDRFSDALNGCAHRGRVVRFWWRDDDATQPTPALNRILDLGERFAVPVTIAVIPARLKKELAVLVDHPLITLAQHGFAHRNHARPEHKKTEFGFDRDADQVRTDLACGRSHFEETFGVKPWLFVPPWNRMAGQWLPMLPDMGYHCISTFTPRWAMPPVRKLVRLNTHVDLIDWKGGSGFIGLDNAIDQILNALAAIKDDEPLGLLTHHQIHDDAVNTFLRTFLQWTQAHPGVQWVASTMIYGSQQCI